MSGTALSGVAAKAFGVDSPSGLSYSDEVYRTGSQQYGDVCVLHRTDLAQNRYFDDPGFLVYLSYLRYWHQPAYVKYIR